MHPATFGDSEPGLEDHRHLWPNGAYLGSASTWPHTQGGMSEFLIVSSDMVRVLVSGSGPIGLLQVGMLATGTHPIELAPLISKEIQLRGCFRFNDEIDEAVRILAETPSIEQVITHEIPADSVVDAFAAAKDSEGSGKVIVNLWHAGASR